MIDYVSISAEICGIAGRPVHQRQERNPPGPGLVSASATSWGQHFWAQGFFVNMVGRDEVASRVSDPSYRFERFTS